MIRASETADPIDEDIPTKIAILDNKMTKVDYDISKKVPIYMSESEKTEHRNDWRT